MDDVQITSEPLEYNSKSAPPQCGATSVFLGTTRRDEINEEGVHVTKLFYEAYVPMAIKELKKICSAIRSKWEKVGPIQIIHRIGDVQVGEMSVIISVSAERRSAAIHGVEFAIEELKEKVPIWKKEFYSNEEAIWKSNSKASSSSERTNTVNDKDSQRIQITASNNEIQRRIDSFAERKRLEVDRNNILEFCNRHYSDENEYSCARTDSLLVKRQGSTSHYRKSKVVNVGNDKTDPTRSVDDPSHSGPKVSRGTEEGLQILEGHLLPGKPIDKDIFARIKSLEDRVLYLEGISPEYFSNQSKENVKLELSEDTECVPKGVRKADLTKLLMETNLKIQQLENEVKIKEETMLD